MKGNNVECIHASMHPASVHPSNSFYVCILYLYELSAPISFYIYIYSLYPTASDIASYTIETPPLPQGGVPLGAAAIPSSPPQLVPARALLAASAGPGLPGAPCPPKSYSFWCTFKSCSFCIVLLVSFFRHSLGLDAVTCTWDVHPGLSSRIFVKHIHFVKLEPTSNQPTLCRQSLRNNG